MGIKTITLKVKGFYCLKVIVITCLFLSREGIKGSDMDQEPPVAIPAVPDQAPIVEISAASDPQWFGLFWLTPMNEFLTYGDSVDLSGTCRAAWFLVQDFRDEP